MTDSQKFDDLQGYEFSDVFVRAWNVIGFAAQKWTNSDSLEQRETAVFFYYPDEPATDMWAVRYLGEATGVHGCAAFLPNERWVFLADDGSVYVVGMGDDDWEKDVSTEKDLFFTNVKSIRKGHAIAVGPKRLVYRRQSASHWSRLQAGLYPQGEKTRLEDAGFRDVDGFGEADMYACGGRGDVWHYNGSVWANIDVPVNTSLRNVCCAEDGFVYITTDRNDILKGRMDQWVVLEQTLTTEPLESIVTYRGQVLVSTVSGIYSLDGGNFRDWNVGAPKMKSYSHLASGDGILVVAGRDEAVSYDGSTWTVIL